MDCPYCQNPDAYGLLPKSQELRFTAYKPEEPEGRWEDPYKPLEQPEVRWVHREKTPTSVQPKFIIPCQDDHN
jgi:hypothetical protein